ncbi:arylacetamide deacetylase-like 2 [Rhodotorula toruloides]|uniref:Arylacetamide deacetylase-like 2 n=1 Tax=Rhodotorula toruloides TaxID=5286 RepID=A0A511KFF6_RHOTO|nr:arylacetamide deacetylase-like 2 [Rhodotorula toruloides]
MPLKPSQTSNGAVHLPLVRGAPDQRLTFSLFLRFWILFFVNAVFLVPWQCFLEYFVLRLFSPVVQEVGRPIYTHYLIKLVQAVYRRSTPAQLRILADRVRSYALVHSAPKFRGWVKKVEVNGTSGRWLAAPGTDRKKDDVVVYYIHGGGFIFDSGINSQDFFLSTIKTLRDVHGIQASGFFLDYRKSARVPLLPPHD